MITNCANKLSYILVDQKDKTFEERPCLLQAQRRYMGEDQIQVIIVKVAGIGTIKCSSLGFLVGKMF